MCSVSTVVAEFHCATQNISGILLRYTTLTAMVSVAAHLWSDSHQHSYVNQGFQGYNLGEHTHANVI
jgi:hypothetical protein